MWRLSLYIKVLGGSVLFVRGAIELLIKIFIMLIELLHTERAGLFLGSSARLLSERLRCLRLWSELAADRYLRLLPGPLPHNKRGLFFFFGRVLDGLRVFLIFNDVGLGNKGGKWGKFEQIGLPLVQFGLFFPVLRLCLPLDIVENQGSIVAVLGVRNELVSLHDTLLDEPVQWKTIDCVLLGLGELNALQVPLSPVVVPVLGLNDFLGILRLGLDVLVFETRFLHAISF